MITQEELKQLLDYNPETGVFTWKVSTSNRIKVGSQAGNLHISNYVIISVKNKVYKAHRLAYLYIHGYMPKYVDHINEVKYDNRICNLRPATKSQNGANRKKHKDNGSGYKGVSWSKHHKRYRAYCQEKFLGMFSCPIEAAMAYDAKAKEIFGDYAKLNFK